MLTGLDMERRIQVEDVELIPDSSYKLKREFYTLSFVQSQSRPDGDFIIQTQRFGKYFTIKPSSWENIWINGLEIILAGYITFDQFQKKAESLSTSRRLNYRKNTNKVRLSVPMGQLRPLQELISRAKSWSNPEIIG